MSTITRSVSAPLRPSRYTSVLESALISVGREDAVVNSTRKPQRKNWCLNRSRSPNRRLDHACSVPAQRSDGIRIQERGDDDADEEEEEKDPFKQLILLKLQRKTKRNYRKEEENEKKKKMLETGGTSCRAVARSIRKMKKDERICRNGVLENVGRTSITRSMIKQEKKEKKKWKRSSLEMMEDRVKCQEEEDEDEEDDDHVVIQKKLFQSPKSKKMVKKQNEEKTRGQKSKKMVVLKHWRVEWPPALETTGKSNVEKATLVLIGQVNGKVKRFIVGKREGSMSFTSKNGENVMLSGKLDRKAAKSAGIPRAAVELLGVGIPAYFSKRLLPYAQKLCDNIKYDKTGWKTKSGKMKKIICADTSRSPLPLIDEEVHRGIEAIIASTSAKVGKVCSIPKQKKSPAVMKNRRKVVKKEEPEPESEGDVWTMEQQAALMDAKLKIPTTAPNFWAQVAQHVPGKSAKDCQAKTFEQFRSPPTNRKAKKPLKRASTKPYSAVPTKIARAGSNKFKKQVREFVEEYEKKHVDDIFETTPSKEGLPELPEFDSIKSPELGTPSHSFDDNDSEMDDEAPGLLKKLSSRRRDDIDSYVLGINRLHVAGGGVMAGGKVRRMTSTLTPVKAAKAKATSVKKKAVMLVEEVGSHSLKGVMSPGGTASVRIEKDGSSSESEEDDYDSSEKEEDFDLP
ncbi:unnamed protein product [Peronospora belbahrii]|uniref:Myb-like domain-containing protein n=1 Tax=Peronospora belbahrii TaxID=622444 RepID=A0AAU9L1I2_9STRA|nr:unnamed protein product [Peronospora belbahrii]CAH0514099.1 unnamed protein product [Peronospora belbahrii]